MARTVKSAEIGTRASRLRLRQQKAPYWCQITKGLHLGYRKGATAGSWVARLYHNGRYVERSIATADDILDSDGIRVLTFFEAQDSARTKHREISESLKPSRKQLTVADAMESYLVFYRKNRKSYAATENRVNVFINPALGHIEVAKLTTRDIESFKNELADTPRRMRTAKGKKQRFYDLDDSEEMKRKRRATANVILMTLKAGLNKAFQEGLVENDAAWRRAKPFRGASAARLVYLSVEEAQRLVKAAEPNFALLAQAALLTGARYSEIARLKAGDFHPETGTVAILVSKTNRPRHVEMTEEGIRFFEKLTKDKDADELLFHRPSGESWLKSNQCYPMRLACKAAGIKPISFHGLRHTYASLALMRGLPQMVVAKNLGHADTLMVQRVYGHLSGSFVRDAIRAHAPRFNFDESQAA